MKYLKFIQYQNLLVLAFMQLIVRYGFLYQQNIKLVLSHFQFGLMVVATICIVAGGFIINEIFNTENGYDNLNNKTLGDTKITEAMAYNLYFVFTIVGVLIGFYLSNTIKLNSFAGAFIICAALLYLYANSFKQILLVGNIVLGLLLSFSILSIALFDLLPITYDGNRASIGLVFSVLLDYAIFIFIISFLSQTTKSLENIALDKNQGVSTLPTTIGIAKTTKIIAAIIILLIFYILYYIYQYYFVNKLLISTLYAIVFVLSPLLYFAIKIFNAKSTVEFNHLNKILKAILILGMVSLSISTYNIYHNV